MAYQRLQQDELSASLQYPTAYIMDDAQVPLIQQSPKEQSNTEKHASSDGRYRALFVIATIVACLCTLANVIFIGVWHRLSFPDKDSALSSEYRQLEVVNSYVGLDTAIYNMPRLPPRPITNFPLLVTLVNAHKPRTVYLENPSRMTKLGTIFPEERQVTISSHQSTLMQFRTLDYGMERCSVVFVLPSKSSPEHSKVSIPIARSHDLTINIWKLHAPSRLDPRHISWTTRPARETLLGTFTIGSNQTKYETPEFSCVSGSLHSFELSCSQVSPDCRLEFLQDVKKPQLAFYVQQESSI